MNLLALGRMRAIAVILGTALGGLTGAFVGGCAGEGGGPKVSEVKSAAELQDKMTTGGVMVVHALDAEHFRKGHIPGAVNIDYEKMTRDMLPEQMDRPMVFYCAGGMCPVGRMAANKARSWGYTNVSVYEGGIKDWRAAGMKVEAGE